MEVTNKELERILTKTTASHKRDWATRLLEVFWAYNTTWKSIIGFSPYELVFGKKPLLPIEFEIQTLRITLEIGLDVAEAQKERLLQLNELDEHRLEALH